MSISKADTDPGDGVDAPLDHTTEGEEGPGLAELSRVLSTWE